ncbi:hypothetical protein L2E82_29310 [Cichorium intybus]|uniref:Uncharacterized protein n=1 Tax=Cichorium intybus TaxID=13427 RepID=A0ACB9CXL1_CICIN|nr:hypothetical protein L2E82_29310 [Cichorium intybus]
MSSIESAYENLGQKLFIRMEQFPERRLFGGAISTTLPLRFEDVSNIREVPDHQEVFVDPARDERKPNI